MARCRVTTLYQVQIVTWRGHREMSEITIGELARRASLNVETIRYYERRGLIPDPRAGNGGTGYRRYPEAAAVQLRFIKRARQLGFSLREIEELLVIRSRPENFCHRLHELALHRLAELQRRIAELQESHDQLHCLVDSCTECANGTCAMLDNLELAPPRLSGEDTRGVG